MCTHLYRGRCRCSVLMVFNLRFIHLFIYFCLSLFYVSIFVWRSDSMYCFVYFFANLFFNELNQTKTEKIKKTFAAADVRIDYRRNLC